MRSFLGSVRTGEGLVWWLDISILIAGFMIANQVKFYRKILIGAAFVSFGICFAMDMSKTFFAPYSFPDYLAFLILALLPLTYSLVSKVCGSYKTYALTYAVLNIFMLFTDNKAMIGFALLFPILVFIYKEVKFFEKLRALKGDLWGLSALPFLFLFTLLAIANYPLSGGFYNFVGSGFFETIASRSYLLLVSLEPLLQNPSMFITGSGWGNYVDHMTQYLPLNWLNLIDAEKGQWDGLYTDHFHSHNIFLEALNSGGVFAFLSLNMFVVAIYSFSSRVMKTGALLFSSGLIVWASFWFFLPLHIPFLALAVAFLVNKPKQIKLFQGRMLKNIVPANKFVLVNTALMTALLFQISAATMIFLTALPLTDYQPQSLTAVEARKNCPPQYNDFGAGGFHLSRMLVDRIRYIVANYSDINDVNNKKAAEKPDKTPQEKKEEEESLRAHILEVNHLYCQAQNYDKNHTMSTRLELSRILTRGELLLAMEQHLDENTKAYYYDGWQLDLLKWLRAHPARSDQAVPYLLFNILHQREPQSYQVIDLIVKNNPNDPIGLWFKGLTLLSNSQKSRAGIALMKKALQNDIQRFMPIEKNTLDILSR